MSLVRRTLGVALFLGLDIWRPWAGLGCELWVLALGRGSLLMTGVLSLAVWGYDGRIGASGRC